MYTLECLSCIAWCVSHPIAIAGLNCVHGQKKTGSGHVRQGVMYSHAYRHMLLWPVKSRSA